MRKRNHWVIAAMAVAALGLAGCNLGGSNQAGLLGKVSPYELALAAIEAADSAEAVASALSAAESTFSDAELQKLRSAAEARGAALAKTARLEAQKRALELAGRIDTPDLSTPELIALAELNNQKLQDALDNAVDLSDADKAAYRKRLADARLAVSRQKQMNELSAAAMLLEDATAALPAASLAQFIAADSARKALTAALEAAVNLKDEEKSPYESRAAKAAEQIAKSRNNFNDEEIRKESERIAGIVREIMEGEIKSAEDAVAGVTDESGAGAVTEAEIAITKAKAKVESADIPVAERHRLRTALAVHEGALAWAKESRVVEDQPELPLSHVIASVRRAVAEVTDDSDDTEVATAQGIVREVREIIESAAIPEADKVTLRAALAEQERKLTAAIASRNGSVIRMGRAMFAALAPPAADPPPPKFALTNVGAVAASAPPDNDFFLNGLRGIKVDPAAGAGALSDSVDPAVVTLTRIGGVDAPLSEGEWKSWEYVREDETSGITDRAYVRLDQSEPVMVPIATVYTDPGYTWYRRAAARGHTAADRTLDIAPDIVDSAYASPAFPASGRWSDWSGHMSEDGTDVVLRGTFQGARGTYRCADACVVNVSSAGVSLSAGWKFVYDEGAMMPVPDRSFLYFGWWIREDSGGMPVASSAFFGAEGVPTLMVEPKALIGTATYEGEAVGAYGIASAPGGGVHGGRFTADAALTAVFGDRDGPGSGSPGVTGMIDNFRLSGMPGANPGWTVALETGPWEMGGAIGAAAPAKTVWSVNGVQAPAAGAWTGRIYDGDRNVGTSMVTKMAGSFYAEFHSTHRMVGAFGADGTFPQVRQRVDE